LTKKEKGSKRRRQPTQLIPNADADEEAEGESVAAGAETKRE
jgi:hypothetical protein